jgi:putative transposase
MTVGNPVVYQRSPCEETDMRGPTPPTVTLPADEQQGLETLGRQPTTAQPLAWRARIMLTAAAGLTKAQMAHRLGLDVATVRRWRQRWLGFQAVSWADLPVAPRLTDAPRPGRPAQITAAQVCPVIALACEAPRTAGRPSSPWTSREIAEAIRTRGMVAQMAPRHAARLFKRGL